MITLALRKYVCLEPITKYCLCLLCYEMLLRFLVALYLNYRCHLFTLEKATSLHRLIQALFEARHLRPLHHLPGYEIKLPYLELRRLYRHQQFVQKRFAII